MRSSKPAELAARIARAEAGMMEEEGDEAEEEEDEDEEEEDEDDDDKGDRRGQGMKRR